MTQLINITKFMIISTTQFDSIIEQYNCNLTVSDPQYLQTYILINIIAYLAIYASIKIILWIYYSFFSKRGEIF